MVAAFQRLPPEALDELLHAPDLLEDYLLGEDDDSYSFDGYGDLWVDISKSRMASWNEIHRRVHGLGGEMRLTNGSVVLMNAVAIEPDVTRWRHLVTGEQDQRAHSSVASLRLIPPMWQRLYRAKTRLSEFVVSVALAAFLLSFPWLHFQGRYGLPPWSWAALILAISGMVLWRSIAVFRRERLVVTYKHRRSGTKQPSRPEPIDIDKAWEPIEAVLTRFSRDEAYAVREAISGGHEIKNSEIGCGPASYSTNEEVVKIAATLSRLSAEAIGEECERDLRDYVVSHFRKLQGYYHDAADDGHAMIRYYC